MVFNRLYPECFCSKRLQTTKMPSAIVTGATGILGREIVYQLSKNQTTWPTVHALSRSKRESYQDNVVFNHADLSASSKEIAKQLEGVKGEYLFYAAYAEKASEQENWDANGEFYETGLP
jgi:nucleoside-diphosphate-sugar epimerase